MAFASAAVAAAGFLAANAFATYPGANGRIAFVGENMPGCSGTPPSGQAICTVQPDGSGLKRISSFGRKPSWSANGRRIVFLTNKAIYTMRADGTDKTKVASTGEARFPRVAFSPSGGRIVFNQYRPNAPSGLKGAIYTIRTDGTHRRLVFAGGADVETPGYSPDGRRIVFAGRPQNRPWAWGIWTIRTDGTGLRALTTNPTRHHAGSDHYPDWSPDGTEIEFLRFRDCQILFCSGPIKFIGPDGSGIHGIGSLGGTGVSYLYAPSGDRLVSRAPIGGDDYAGDCTDIVTVAVAGGDRQTVTDNCANFDSGGPRAYARDPSWQPLPGD